MSSAARRTVATTLALTLLAACGGKSTPAPPAPLELACSVSTSGPDPVLTVLGRAHSAATTGAPIPVTLALSPTPRTLALGSPGWTGTTELRGETVAVGDTVSGQATVDGALVTASCVATAGLPGLSAQAFGTASEATFCWSPVAGAVVYGWGLRETPAGPHLGSGIGSDTSVQVVVALDPLKTYELEVGAYAVSGNEASYPTPLPSPKASFTRTTVVAGGPVGGGASAWQLFTPAQYQCGALTVDVPALGSGERLAVLLVNAGGDDGRSATVGVTGTGDPSLSLAAAPLAARAPVGDRPGPTSDLIDRSGVMAGEVAVSAWREETIARLRDGRLQRASRPGPGVAPLAALAAAPLPDTRYFCQGQYGSAGFTQVWKHATKAHEKAGGNAAFYVTDDVAAGLATAVAARPDFWDVLDNAYDGKILPALTTYFGAESDVDGNGKMIFLFANLGKSGTSFPVGYFWPGDIELPLATATSCPRNVAGNRADMLYLVDPGNFTHNWDPSGANYGAVLDSIVDGEYPSTMAHELQHDVNYNTRFPQGSVGGVDEALWLNEGLSMLSETVSGYGLHTAQSRANVRTYQGTDTSTNLPYYQAYGMTLWEGDPYGNYAGVQAYMQYLLDHATPAMTRALENMWLSGKANVEAATGIPWEIGFARFATAAMFSNEDLSEPNGATGTITSAANLLADPLYNYLGDGVPTDYVPWHHYTGSCTSGGVVTPKARVANVAYTPLASTAIATLRTDGWAAFATGPGAGGGATLTVRSTAVVRPHVVVVKYSGHLPNFVQPTCP